MFCRSCWANLPDGTAQCPKCQADPSASPASAAIARPRPAQSSPPAPRPTLDRITRLNVLLGVLLVVVVTGPSTIPWIMVRLGLREPEPAASDSPGPAQPPPETPRGPEPAPAAPEAGPEETLGREAYTLYRDGRVAEACDRYRDLATRTGSREARRNSALCLARLGRDADQAGLTQVAAERYERAAREYPEAAPIWMGLGLAYLKLRDFRRAESVLAQGVGSFPDDAEMLYLLAEVQERQGRTRDAAESLRRLLGAHPQHGRGRTLLAALERDQKVEGDYWSQESRHFLVRYEGAKGIDVGRSVVDSLEEAYDSIGRDLGVVPAERIQVGIYAADIFGELTGTPPHLIAGVYDRRRIRLNLAASRAYSASLSRLVRHEYAHAVIHEASAGRAPLWVHEGLAQVLEPRSAPRSLRAAGVPAEYLTLNGIERLSRAGEPRALVAGYALTHVAVEYLVERGGLGKMRDFLARLAQGEPVEQALRGAFGFGPEEIESRLRAVADRG